MHLQAQCNDAISIVAGNCQRKAVRAGEIAVLSGEGVFELVDQANMEIRRSLRSKVGRRSYSIRML